MTLISGENISKQFTDKAIFKDLSFTINKGERIGLVGPNGIGKTTLFEIIAGRTTPDDGRVIRAKNCAIDYIEQTISGNEELALFSYVSSARDDLLNLRSKIDITSQELEKNPNSPGTIEKLGELQHRFENEGGYNFDAEVKIILAGLGFPENRFHNRIGDFSGGEKNRASLARLLAGRSNLLLLDEPTNHLDIDSTIWLEEYLKSLDKTYLIVSHDRTFLTNSVEKVWEISGKKIEQYFNGFERYLVERQERWEQQRKLFVQQQEEIERIKDFIRRNIVGQKTKLAQSRRKYLDRIEKIEFPEASKKAPSFSVNSGSRSYNLVLSMENASFGYDHNCLLSNINLKLYRGDRCGLVGPNGSGKTTILKSILAELDLIEGSAKIGNKVEIAYFDQALSDLDNSNTVIDEIWQIDPLTTPARLRSFLARFGLRGEEVFKKVAVLSGGEKTKLALAKLLFMPANFLIFDEPTNHLDLDSRQALEEALLDYTGTYLIVSHDRFFLDRVVNKIAAIENGTIKPYSGNYSYYRARKESRSESPVKKPAESGKLQEYKDFKKLSRTKGRIKKELRENKARIKETEILLKQLESNINYNIPRTNWEKLSSASKEKLRLEELLLHLYEKLDELKRISAEYSDS